MESRASKSGASCKGSKSCSTRSNETLEVVQVKEALVESIATPGGTGGPEDPDDQDDQDDPGDSKKPSRKERKLEKARQKAENLKKAPATPEELINEAAFSKLTWEDKAKDLVTRFDPSKDREIHIKQTHHSWDLLVPDMNYGTIKEFMIRTIIDGTSELVDAKRGIFQASASINGRILEVEYRKILGSIINVTNGWVKQ